METQAAVTDHHEAAAGPCPSGGEDLHRQVGPPRGHLLIAGVLLCCQLHVYDTL